MAEVPGERGKNQTNIRAARDVIADDDRWTFYIFEMLAANDVRMGEKLSSRPDQRVINHYTRQAHGFALCPAGIVVFGTRILRRRGIFFPGLGDQSFKVGDGFRFGKGGFVDFNIIAVLEGRKEFDAVERR